MQAINKKSKQEPLLNKHKAISIEHKENAMDVPTTGSVNPGTVQKHHSVTETLTQGKESGNSNDNQYLQVAFQIVKCCMWRR